MDGEFWLAAVREFFFGLTGLLVATLPLILQLRSNQKSVRVNTVAAAANTVALNHVAREALTPEIELGRLRAAIMPLLDPEVIDEGAVLRDVRRNVAAVLARRDGERRDGGSIAPADPEDGALRDGLK